MAWEHNQNEVEAYISVLRTLRYSENGVIKTGIDNYKFTIEKAKSYIEKRRMEQELLATVLSNQILKLEYYITKIEENLSQNNLKSNYEIFINNNQQAMQQSTDMNNVSNKTISIIAVDLGKLKQYKRSLKEVTARYFETQTMLSFFNDAESIFTEVMALLNT